MGSQQHPCLEVTFPISPSQLAATLVSPQLRRNCRGCFPGHPSFPYAHLFFVAIQPIPGLLWEAFSNAATLWLGPWWGHLKLDSQWGTAGALVAQARQTTEVPEGFLLAQSLPNCWLAAMTARTRRRFCSQTLWAEQPCLLTLLISTQKPQKTI